MSSYLDREFINKISNRLEGFIWRGNNAVARCFVCGDSSVKKNKKRLYFICKDNSYYAYCHNCGYTGKMSDVLKRLDYGIYKEYVAESLKERQPNRFIREKVIEDKRIDHGEYFSKLADLPTIERLPKAHAARTYLSSRHLHHCFDTFRYTDKFRSWTNLLIPGKFSSSKHDEPRIIIPFFDEHHRFFGYTGRVIEGDGPRYILIILDSSVPLLFGLDRLDKRKKITVVEGPIDSTHLDNCVALAGSNIAALTYIKNYSKVVVVYDNEPRHKETYNKIDMAINHGYDVCIWPKWVEYKDINTMICAGWSPKYIQDIINNNTFSGINAKIHLAQWSR